MKKKLPNIFAKRINKKIENNYNISVTKESNNLKLNQESKNKIIAKNVNQKINDIFASPNYIYKADVIISKKDGEIQKRIVGKNKNYLITINNELIPINEILDIKLKNEL